jgi:DNA-directed RNA polymerase subunit RPC12/RpoP
MRKDVTTEGQPKIKDIPTLFLAALALVALFLAILAKYLTPSPSWMAMSAYDTIIAFVSFYFAYLITQHGAAERAREDLRDLAKAAGYRILLLAHQMQQLASELRSSEPRDYNSLAARIEQLAQHTDLSVDDLGRIAGIKLPLSEIRGDVETRFETVTRREQIRCPHCDAQVDVIISIASGATKRRVCPDCRKGFVVCRASDGSLKVIHTGHFEIHCPKCNNKIGISTREEMEWDSIVRNCYECYARILCDPKTQEVWFHSYEEPLSVTKIEIAADGQRYARCPYCWFLVNLSGMYKNSKGKKLISCPRCTRLLEIVNEAAS